MPVGLEHAGHDLKRILELREPSLAIRKPVAVRAPLLLFPARTQTEDRATVGDQVHRRDHLGQQGRVAVTGAGDYLSELDMRSLPRASAVKVVYDSITISSVGSGVGMEVIEHPDRVEPKLVGALRDFDCSPPGALGLSQPAYSPVQPWGTMTPSFNVGNPFGSARQWSAAMSLSLVAHGRRGVTSVLQHCCDPSATAVRVTATGETFSIEAMATTMLGAILPGDRKVELRTFSIPEPGHGQVLLRMKASTICGSDIRAIYREHLGVGAEAYQGVIAGHKPSGEVVALGPGTRRLEVADRVAVYHIAGCGQCDECRHGYEIGCQSELRKAYGWQRDGGHADYLLAEERSCLRLPDELTFMDGACVACGFGTAYEALLRAGLSGNDSLFVSGLGPVGQAVGMLGRAMGAFKVVGVDPSPERSGAGKTAGRLRRCRRGRCRRPGARRRCGQRPGFPGDG